MMRGASNLVVLEVRVPKVSRIILLATQITTDSRSPEATSVNHRYYRVLYVVYNIYELIEPS